MSSELFPELASSVNVGSVPVKGFLPLKEYEEISRLKINAH